MLPLPLFSMKNKLKPQLQSPSLFELPLLPLHESINKSIYLHPQPPFLLIYCQFVLAKSSKEKKWNISTKCSICLWDLRRPIPTFVLAESLLLHIQPVSCWSRERGVERATQTNSDFFHAELEKGPLLFYSSVDTVSLHSHCPSKWFGLAKQLFYWRIFKETDHLFKTRGKEQER